MKRVGVVGDVHAQDALLEAALSLFADQGVDGVLCTGDVVDGTGDAERCVALLQQAGAVTVRGNHDRWLLHDQMRHVQHAQDRAALSPGAQQWLATRPVQAHLATVAGEVLLCHGLGPDDMNRLTPDDYGYSLEANDALQALAAAAPPRLVVKGHTHHRAVYATGPLNVLDAGTLAEHGPSTVAVLDLEAEEVRWFGWAGGWREEHVEPLPQVEPHRPLPRDHTDLRR